MSASWDPAAAPVAALEQLPAVVWAFTGPDHVAVLANRAAREYRGGSRAYVLGRSLRESLLPENRPLIALLDEVYRTGATRTFYETAIRVDQEDRFVTFTAAPLCDDAGAIIGVLTYMTDVTESVLAKRAAERDHAVLQALQERLLPDGLPVLPDLRVAARYRAAGEQLVAGGDWFDATVLGPGRLGASVGDVVSHGPGAAAVMGQLRSVLGAALLDTGSAFDALAQLRRFVPTVPGARGSTACAAIYEAATGTMSYACAGHPPPVLMRSDGAARFLPAPPSAPLGLPGITPPAGEVVLGPGDSVLLYSDGAVERPGVPTEHGRQRLLQACSRAAAAGHAAAELVDAVLEGVADGAPADDLALLVLSRRPAPVPALLVRLPATARNLSALRRALGGWLAQAGVSDDDGLAVQIACGEATANVVEHAYPVSGQAGAWGGAGIDGAGGEVTVSGELTAESAVVVRVTDAGTWREPPADPADRGRGLLLMRQCVDSVRVRQDGGGTTVELTRRVHSRQSAAAPAPEPAGQPPPGLQVRVDTGTGRATAVLAGDLDAAGVSTAGLALRRAARGGLLPLTVDLTGLDHLASAGVRLLFDVAEELASAGNRLHVQVAQGSVAHHVLDLTGFAGLGRVDMVVMIS